jgi:rubrerythrin
MGTKDMTHEIEELLLQALETERGGIQIYTAAVEAAQNEDLKEEWEKYLSETQHHEEVLTGVFEQLGLDTEKQTPGRKIVGELGKSLVTAIRTAIDEAGPDEAQVVAAECVVLAETKDHSNWELIGRIAKKGGHVGKILKPAYEEVEKEEDHHLYHTKGWARELWIEALGMRAVLPPPEEVKDVETAIGAARAEQQRTRIS